MLRTGFFIRSIPDEPPGNQFDGYTQDLLLDHTFDNMVRRLSNFDGVHDFIAHWNFCLILTGEITHNNL